MEFIDYVVFGLVITSTPFFMIGAGFLYSLKNQGPEGVAWRIRIALACDRLGASLLGYPDKMTICGFVGRRSQVSNNFSWKVYVKIIESLPWFAKGHCIETAEKEKDY